MCSEQSTNNRYQNRGEVNKLIPAWASGACPGYPASASLSWSTPDTLYISQPCPSLPYANSKILINWFSSTHSKAMSQWGKILIFRLQQYLRWHSKSPGTQYNTIVYRKHIRSAERTIFWGRKPVLTVERESWRRASAYLPCRSLPPSLSSPPPHDVCAACSPGLAAPSPSEGGCLAEKESR